MKNCKICMLTNTHPPLDHRVFYKESLSLQKQGYNVYVIGVDYNKKESYTKDGINIIQIKRVQNKILKRILSLPSLYRAAKKIDCEIYHCHDLDAAFLGFFLKKLHKKKLVFDIHEYNAEIIIEGASLPRFLKPFLKKIVKKIDSKIAKKSDYIITVDERLQKIYNIYNKNCVSIPNFINPQGFQNTKIQKTNDILYVGGLSKNRGLFQIINAANQLKQQKIDFKIVFVGGFINNSDKNKVEQQIKKYSLQEQIIFEGKKPYSEVPKYLSRSKIGLLILMPSKRYLKGSYPVKLFEYMYHKIPVIASNFPGIKEIIQEEKCGILVDPNNVEEITKAIKYLLQNAKEAEKMGENARKAIQNKYNWQKQVEKLEKIYQKI